MTKMMICGVGVTALTVGAACMGGFMAWALVWAFMVVLIARGWW